MKVIKANVNELCRNPCEAEKNITTTFITTTGRRAFIFSSARAPPEKTVSILYFFRTTFRNFSEKILG